LKKLSQKLFDWLRIGMEFKGGGADLNELSEIFFRFFLDLGIRRINKVCIF
jgi:hypothetical protein